MLVHLFITSLLSTRRTEDQRAFSVGPRGMSQASLILLSVCLPAQFLTLPWSSAPGMPSLFLENSSGSTHHAIRGSNRFSMTVLKCSAVFLHLKMQSGNHTIQKNPFKEPILHLQTIFDMTFLAELYYPQSVLWIGLTGGGVRRHGQRSSLSVNGTLCNGVAASLSQQLCPGGTLAASLVQGALEATSASLRWHQTGSFCLLHVTFATFAETGHER